MTVVTIIGGLVRDAEVRIVGEYAVINMTVASTKKLKNKDKTCYAPVEYWVKADSKLPQYLKKGTQVALNGELETQSWEKEGQKFSKLVVRANTLQLVGGKSAPADTPAPAKAPASPEIPETDIDEDEIPF